MSKYTTNYFCHDSSYIDDACHIGENTKIWHFCHILSGTKIGNNCTIGQNVMIGPNVIIGNNCKIQNNVSIYEGITIKDDVFIGPSTVFTNVKNPRAFINRKNKFRPTLIGQGATIGANATIICGNTIGDYALIGAGSLVLKDVAKHSVIGGNPGIVIGKICKCGKTIYYHSQKSIDCKECGGTF